MQKYNVIKPIVIAVTSYADREALSVLVEKGQVWFNGQDIIYFGDSDEYVTHNSNDSIEIWLAKGHIRAA